MGSEYRTDQLTGRTAIIAEHRDARPSDFLVAQPEVADRPCPFCPGNEEETPPPLAVYGPSSSVLASDSPSAVTPYSSGPSSTASRSSQSSSEQSAISAGGPSSAGPSSAGLSSQENEGERTRAVTARASTWLSRVVPNKYPAVAPAKPGSGSAEREDSRNGRQSLSVPGIGDHEVIIESPRHLYSFAQFTADEMQRAFRVYRDRLREHRRQGEWQYGQLFKNVGPEAGASLGHTHSQLILLPHVPDEVVHRSLRMEAHFSKTGRGLLDEMSQGELEHGVRMVEGTSRLIAYCPFASRFAFECRIVPRVARPHFDEMDDEELTQLAALVRRLVKSLEWASNRAAYNVVVQTAPFAGGQSHYHWHLEIIPRTSKQAGFELGSGMWINPVAPEHAAELLRSAPVSSKPL